MATPSKHDIHVAYPVFSTRQATSLTRSPLTKNLAYIERNDIASPIKHTPSRLRHAPSINLLDSPSSPSSSPGKREPESFMFPKGAEMSMLNDVTMGGLDRHSLGNSSEEDISMNLEDLRMKNTARKAETGSDNARKLESRSDFLAPPSPISRNPNHFDPNASTLLPVSPMKSRHLMDESNLLTNFQIPDETMLDMSIMPTCTRKTPKSRHIQTHRPDSKSPVKEQKARDVGDLTTFKGDMTMDIQTMMARRQRGNMGKVEESFVDLMRADIEDDADLSSGMDESFIPQEIKALVRSKSLSKFDEQRRSAKKASAPPLSAHLLDAYESPSKSPHKSIERMTKKSAPPLSTPGRFARPEASSAITGASNQSPIKHDLNGHILVKRTPGSSSISTKSKRISLSAGPVLMPSTILRKALESPSKPPQPPAPSLQRPTTSGTDRHLPASKLSVDRKSIAPSASLSSLSRKDRPSLRPPTSAPLTTIASRASSTARPSMRPMPVSISTQAAPKMATNRMSRPPVASSRFSTAPAPAPSKTSTFNLPPPRPFGGNVTGSTNRPAPAASDLRTTKSSMAPTGFPPKQSVSSIPSTAKSRALSTPASVIAGSKSSTAPSQARSSAFPSRVPHGATSRITSTTTLKSSTSSSATVKPPTTAGRTGTIQRSGSSVAAAGLADIRARLDKLQARQASRAAR